MTDTLLFQYIAIAIVSSLAGLLAFYPIKRWLHRRAVVEVKLRHLKDHLVRSELSGFLRAQNVFGDADIRDGVVYAPVPADRLEPLAVVLGNAAAMLARFPNRAADSLYLRNADGSLILTGIDLDHLVDAARVMQRVAEDRRKTRSIYKGMTEEEMISLTRAGLSQAFKDEGEFEMSNKIMSGDYDNSPEFRRAMHVLDLTFRVKGARND